MGQTVKVNIRWDGNLQFTGFDEQNHRVIFDSAPEGVIAAGPTPMQLFLQALAACSSMDIVTILQKRRLKIDSFEVQIEGERVDTFPKIYKTIRLKYIVSAAGIKESDMEIALDLSLNKFCSVAGMIDRSKTEVIVEYEIR